MYLHYHEHYPSFFFQGENVLEQKRVTVQGVAVWMMEGLITRCFLKINF